MKKIKSKDKNKYEKRNFSSIGTKICKILFLVLVTLQIFIFLGSSSLLLPSLTVSLLKVIVLAVSTVVFLYIIVTPELSQKMKEKQPATDSSGRPEGETDLRHFKLVIYVIFSVLTIAAPVYYSTVIQSISLCDGLFIKAKEKPTITSIEETEAEKAKKELESTLSKKCIKFYKDYNNFIKDEEKN